MRGKKAAFLSLIFTKFRSTTVLCSNKAVNLESKNTVHLRLYYAFYCTYVFKIQNLLIIFVEIFFTTLGRFGQ
jgi:hypothetical protein